MRVSHVHCVRVGMSDMVLLCTLSSARLDRDNSSSNALRQIAFF